MCSGQKFEHMIPSLSASCLATERLKRLRPLWPLHRTRRWLATSCDRYCRTANQRSLNVKKTLFKYATSFHEMENFPWCASPRAFQRYQMGLVRITSWYPNFNGSHFGLPPSEIHRMTGLPPKVVWTMTYSHRPHLRGIANANQNDERFKMWSVNGSYAKLRHALWRQKLASFRGHVWQDALRSTFKQWLAGPFARLGWRISRGFSSQRR